MAKLAADLTVGLEVVGQPEKHIGQPIVGILSREVKHRIREEVFNTVYVLLPVLSPDSNRLLTLHQANEIGYLGRLTILDE